jgi:hypothetical protein
MRDDEAHVERVRSVATFRRERERERVNGEDGVIRGGGVAGEELNVIVRERREERREEKGRRKEKKKKLQRGVAVQWPSHPQGAKGGRRATPWYPATPNFLSF